MSHLTPETAPRTVAELQALNPLARLRLAHNLLMFPETSAEMAFMGSTAEQQAAAVLAFLQQHDATTGAAAPVPQVPSALQPPPSPAPQMPPMPPALPVVPYMPAPPAPPPLTQAMNMGPPGMPPMPGFARPPVPLPPMPPAAPTVAIPPMPPTPPVPVDPGEPPKPRQTRKRASAEDAPGMQQELDALREAVRNTALATAQAIGEITASLQRNTEINNAILAGNTAILHTLLWMNVQQQGLPAGTISRLIVAAQEEHHNAFVYLLNSGESDDPEGDSEGND